MAKYRKISTRIWNDDKFSLLSCDAKLLFFFLLSHPHMTPLGAMRANSPGIAHELSWSLERLSEALREVSAKGMVGVDERVSCVFLPNFVKHNLPESPNVILAWEKCLDDIPDCSLKNKAIHTAREVALTMSEAFQKAFGRLSEVFHKGMPNQEQEPEPEQEPLNNLPDSANRAGAVDADAEIFYLSKKRKKLKGEVLESFNRFWKAFAYFHGKAEAADAWLSVYSHGMVDPAVNAAILEAQNRPEQIAKGKTPKWAQGWLTGRRWEDGAAGQVTGNTCKTCDYDHRPGYCDHKTPEQRKNCQSWTAVKA